MYASWGSELISTGMPRNIAELTENPLVGEEYFKAVIHAVSSKALLAYLWGMNGNGKTHMGSWLYSHWHAQNLRAYQDSDRMRWYPSAKWTSSNALTAALKNFSRDDFDFEREMRVYTKPDTLMIDDLWPDRRTETDVQNLVEIVETRTNNGRRTVITGNHNPSFIHSEISRRFGDRLNDHLVIEFTGGSHRLFRRITQ